MVNWLRQLDDILRGDATLMSSMRDGRIDIPVGGLSAVIVALGAIYGACMGSFGLLHPQGNGLPQVLASAVKLPLLFFLTLVVTFPSLYVFNALVGSRLSMTSVLRLLVAMLGVMLAVLASLGPIVVFFSLSTTSYPFMKLLNVAVCATAGVLGLAFLLRTLHRLVLVQELADAKRRSIPPAPPTSAPPPPAEPATPPQANAEANANADAAAVSPPPTAPPGPDADDDQDHARGALELIGDETDRRARIVFRIWVVVFSLVGAQMSWVLRPFIGAPGLEFAWFRPRQSNFFEAVLIAIANLFT